MLLLIENPYCIWWAMFAAISEKGYGKLSIIYTLVYYKCKN